MVDILNMSLDISGDKLEADGAFSSTRFDSWEKMGVQSTLFTNIPT